MARTCAVGGMAWKRDQRPRLQLPPGPGGESGGPRPPGGLAVRAKTDCSTPTWDVAEVVGRAADGDQLAWERLFDQYARLIWSMTRDFKLVESDAADVFQTTWLRLLEHINRLDHPARVGSWLAATARHECLRSWPRRKRIVLMHGRRRPGRGGIARPGDRRTAAGRRAAPRPSGRRCRVCRGRWQRLLQHADDDPPASYAGDLRPARPAGRQHRPDPGPLPGTATGAAAGLLSLSPAFAGAGRLRRQSVGRDPAPACGLDLRVGAPDLGQQVSRGTAPPRVRRILRRAAPG